MHTILKATNHGWPRSSRTAPKLGTLLNRPDRPLPRGVAMDEVTFVTSVTLSLDGFCYPISVYRKTGGFFAFWECGQCGDQGAPSIPATDRDAAIMDCKKLI